jgi:hypothetical protein
MEKKKEQSDRCIQVRISHSAYICCRECWWSIILRKKCGIVRLNTSFSASESKLESSRNGNDRKIKGSQQKCHKKRLESIRPLYPKNTQIPKCINLKHSTEGYFHPSDGAEFFSAWGSYLIKKSAPFSYGADFLFVSYFFLLPCWAFCCFFNSSCSFWMFGNPWI